MPRKASKEAPEECTICYDAYTPIRRKKVICRYCNNPTCSKCIETYLLSVIEDAHCPHCRVNYSDSALLDICTRTYLTQTYFKHRQEILMNHERAMLPGLQDIAQEKRMRRALEEQLKVIRVDITKLITRGKELELARDNKYNERYVLVVASGRRRHLNHPDPEVNRLTQEINDIYANMRVIREDISERRNTLYQLTLDGNAAIRAELELNETAGGPVNEKKKFVRRCTADGCTGYINHMWHCGLCRNYICNKCFAVKGVEHDAAHTCKQEDVDTAELIKKDSKPCPGCGEFINKASGCDMMWCVSCHTPFSWNSGKIIHGGINHNPHFYEWQRRNNGGEAPRVRGDIPYGGIPHYYALRPQIIKAYSSRPDTPYYTILEIHRICTEIQELVQEKYRSHLDRSSIDSINIRFLLKEYDEKMWGLMLAKNEKRRKRDRDIQDIFAAFNMAAVELFNRIMQHETITTMSTNDVKAIITGIIDEFMALIELINEAFKKSSIEYKYIVPQIKPGTGLIYKNFAAELKGIKHKRADDQPLPVEMTNDTGTAVTDDM